MLMFGDADAEQSPRMRKRNIVVIEWTAIALGGTVFISCWAISILSVTGNEPMGPILADRGSK
jgi:hypothetical protein